MIHLESLESRIAPSGIPSPQVEMVCLSQNPSMDAAFSYLASLNSGKVTASVTLPSWESALGPANAVRMGLLLGQIPYQGTSTVLVVVMSGNFIPYHELLPAFGGQVPLEVTPGDSPGHPEIEGDSFDLAALCSGYFTTDPPPPYYAAPEQVPGMGTLTIDYVTGKPSPGPDSAIQAPNLYAADVFFSLLADFAHI